MSSAGSMARNSATIAFRRPAIDSKVASSRRAGSVGRPCLQSAPTRFGPICSRCPLVATRSSMSRSMTLQGTCQLSDRCSRMPAQPLLFRCVRRRLGLWLKGTRRLSDWGDGSVLQTDLQQTPPHACGPGCAGRYCRSGENNLISKTHSPVVAPVLLDLRPRSSRVQQELPHPRVGRPDREIHRRHTKSCSVVGHATHRSLRSCNLKA